MAGWQRAIAGDRVVWMGGNGSIGPAIEPAWVASIAPIP